MTTEIVEIAPGRRGDRRRFAALPFELAAEHEAWQPGLRRLHEELIDPRRNPFWRERRGSFFLARRNGKVVGRVAVVDPGTLPDRPWAAVLAFPDFVDDTAVATALFDAAERRARARAATELIGPLNPDIHHDVGIQVDGHEHRNAMMMGFQPPYYARRFASGGFEPLCDFEAWGLYRETFVPDPRLLRAVGRIEGRPSFRIRPVDLRRFDRELDLFFRLYAGAFADHWGFSAPTWDEFRFIAGDLRYLLRPNMSFVAEWEGVPAGFVLGVPDLHCILPKRSRGRITPRLLFDLFRRWRGIDEARVMIAGVLPAYRRHGIHLPLFHRVARAIFELGFRGGEISWVMADNQPMARALSLLGARRTKTYRLYRKALHQ